MLTRPIFIRPNSELIRESICACAKLFVDEENVGCAKIESWKNKNIDRFYMKTTQKVGFSKLWVKTKKWCYTYLLHFSTCKHNLVYFFGLIATWLTDYYLTSGEMFIIFPKSKILYFNVKLKACVWLNRRDPNLNKRWKQPYKLINKQSNGHWINRIVLRK